MWFVTGAGTGWLGSRSWWWWLRRSLRPGPSVRRTPPRRIFPMSTVCSTRVTSSTVWCTDSTGVGPSPRVTCSGVRSGVGSPRCFSFTVRVVFGPDLLFYPGYGSRLRPGPRKRRWGNELLERSLNFFFFQ